MTTFQFSDPVERALDDETPIIFEWIRADVTPTVQVAFDNVNFSDINGSVTEITPLNGKPRFRINYHVDDRPTSPTIITYKIAQATDIAYLEVRFTTPYTTQEIPDPIVDIDPSLVGLVELIGPRRVKTKDMDIERDSIKDLQQVLERRSKKPVSLNQMRYDIVVPRLPYRRGCDCD